jgi:hypothetical protein
MQDQVFVFSGYPLSKEQLSLVPLGWEKVFYWAADEGNFEMGKDLPGEWRERGAVFCGWAELRYWKKSGGEYEALLIADRQPPPGVLSPEGWISLSGEWEGSRVKEMFLQDLSEPRVRPRFSFYPNGCAGGVFEARVIYKNEMPVWISPRGFAKKRGADGE